MRVAFFSRTLRLPRIATLDELFGLDLRSLALVRVLIASIVLVDLAIRASALTAHYGDLGVLPAAAAFSFWSERLGLWSLHLWGGGPLPLLVGLFVLHAITAFALLVGYKTRFATIATWALLVSLHNANPIVIQGGDTLLRAVLFVGMLLPWGAVWSVDSLKRGPPERMRIVSVWSAAYIFQLAFLYFFAASHKSGPEWWHDGSAVYYALSIDQMVTPVGKFLLTQLPDILPALTFGVLALQSIALFLFFYPIYTTFIRSAVVWCLMLMHLSFGICIYLGPFSWTAIAALCGLIPSSAWDAFFFWLRKRYASAAAKLSPNVSSEHYLEERMIISNRLLRILSLMGSVLGVAYITFVFFWQAAGSPLFETKVVLSDEWVTVAKAIRIDQRWELFSSMTPNQDGWYVIPGTLQNGERVDLFRGGAPVTFDRPDTIASLYKNERWRKYMMNLSGGAYSEYRDEYAQYLCRSWNDSHSGGERLLELELIFMRETIGPPPGTAPASVAPGVLLAWTCED